MAKYETPPDVTDTELAVLGVLWDQRVASVRSIAEVLYKGSAKSRHATVQKFLDRLKAKGYVARDATVWPHVFRPAIQRDELIQRRLQKVADKFYNGSMQPLISHLLRDSRTSKGDLQALRGLLDELDEKKE